MTSATSMYGPGAPKEIFSGRFTKLTEVSLFYCRVSLSPRFTLDLLPPHATALPLSLPFSLLSTSLVSCTVVHKFLGSISIPQRDSFGKPLQPWRLEAASMKEAGQCQCSSRRSSLSLCYLMYKIQNLFHIFYPVF